MNKPFVVSFESGHWGLVDQLGAQIIPFFKNNDTHGGWSEGRLLVRRGVSLSLVAEDGSIIKLNGMRAASEALPQFSEGLMPMGFKEKIGFIDRDGSWIIEPIYDNAWDFREGTAIVTQNEATHLITRRGLVLNSLHSLYVPELREWPEDNYCFRAWDYRVPEMGHPCIVERFQSVLPFIDAIGLGDPYQGVVGVQSEDELWRLNTFYGLPVSGESWTSLFSFSCGLAVACSLQGLFGAINSRGDWILNPVYDQLEPFRFGFSVAEQAGRKTIIDTLGKEIFAVAEGSPYILKDHILIHYRDRTEIRAHDGTELCSFASPGK